ncbi:MAG: glycoside hydrolase family 18 protein [Abitibacteriaceae bacterium]|nr:glycoside hydrolase family 18 protein [Abditibacteriaceae bacterium]
MRWRNLQITVYSVFMASLLYCASTCGAAPGDTSNTKPFVKEFTVIAYLPEYRFATLDAAALSYLTDLILFSIEPKSNGELDTARIPSEVLARLNQLRTGHHLRILVALGGADRSEGFASMATNPQTRTHFIQELLRFCTGNHLDGIDFDWEHPTNNVEEEAYAVLLQETKQQFQAHNLLVTVAVADWQHLSAEAYRAVDRVHLMAYDHEGQHSTFTQAAADVQKMLKQGVPRAKLCLGVPFYGRSIKNSDQSLTYAEIMQQYHPLPNSDEVAGIYFNGIQTMRQKTRYALEQHLGGVMIWELGQDTHDQTSLLLAIHQTVIGK